LPTVVAYFFGRSNIDAIPTFKVLQNLIETRRTDAVIARFIFLKLLLRDAQPLRKLGLA
jgi:hypothetical protein